MSKLQRYFIYGDNLYATYADEDALSSAYSICHENGDWVKYEDAKKLEEENRKLHLWKEGAINFYPNLEGMEMHEADIGGCHEFN